MSGKKLKLFIFPSDCGVLDPTTIDAHAEILVTSGNQDGDVAILGCSDPYVASGSFGAECVDGEWESRGDGECLTRRLATWVTWPSANSVKSRKRSGKIGNTVYSRYLELGYLEFCKTRSVYLNQKYILVAFSNHHLALETFLQVQITRSAN